MDATSIVCKRADSMADNLNSAEQLQHAEKLQRLLQKADMPTLPLVAQKLIDLCRDDQSAFADFARVIESDPGLASRILRVTNSAYYGLRNKATTLDRAIGVLGLKYVKTVSLGFRLATVLAQFETQGFRMEEFWQKSVLRGVLARQLAQEYCPGRAQEAFLVGLLEDCGILFLIQALGMPYVEMWQNARGSEAALFRLEQEVFEYNHLEAAEVLTQQWSIPELIARPIRTHHRRPFGRPTEDEQIQLSQIAYFVGTLSFNGPEALSEEDLTLLKYCHNVFGLDKTSLKRFLREARLEFISISEWFKELIDDKLNVAELLGQANDLLSDLAANTAPEMFVLETEVQSLRAQCEDLTDSMDQYQKQAETDDLTGLYGRARLERFLDNASWRVKNSETSLAVMFFDVDNFKDINNTYSHAVGDRLLQQLAVLIRELFGESGCPCRYGGDEFVVALMGLKLKEAVQLAAGLTERIRSVPVVLRASDDRSVLDFSCSVGMLFCEVGSQPGNCTRILEVADGLMYSVKKSGKNDMYYNALLPGEDQLSEQTKLAENAL